MSTPVPPLPHYPRCPICTLPVNMENCKTDENGRAVHEECYVLKIKATSKKPQTSAG
jgi:hypothetical protein